MLSHGKQTNAAMLMEHKQAAKATANGEQNGMQSVQLIHTQSLNQITFVGH